MGRLSLLFVFALIISVSYTAFAADKSAQLTTTYKAELSGQAEVPAVQPAPGETKPTGEAIFQFSGPGIKGGGAGGAGETGAAGPGGEVKKGGADSSYYSGILDKGESTGSEGAEGGGGTAKSEPDSNYYSGILIRENSSGSAAGGTAGDVLHYKLNVRDIENVTAAHLHMGKKGTATAKGPVIAPLYTGPEKTGKFSGLLAEGTITDKDLKGPLSGKSVRDLAKLMNEGNVFVNVHTAQHPAGEIRGEVAPK